MPDVVLYQNPLFPKHSYTNAKNVDFYAYSMIHAYCFIDTKNVEIFERFAFYVNANSLL